MLRVQAVRQATPGVTGSSQARVHIDLAVWYIAVGLGHPGGAGATKGWVVHPLKTYTSWVQNPRGLTLNISLVVPSNMIPRNPKIKLPKVNLGLVVDSETDEYIEVRSSKRKDSARAELPKFLDPTQAYLIGAMRDGTLSTSGSKYEISYAQKDTRWLKFIERLLMEIFKPTTKLQIINYKFCSPRLFTSNKGILKFFNLVYKIPIGNKKEWTTPKIILRAPFEIQKYYVAGFFDADGIIRNDGRIGFCQSNKIALLDVRNMLIKHGISCCDVTYQPRNKVHYFNIRKDSNNLFVSLIGSYNPAKLERILTLQGEQNVARQFGSIS